MARLALILTLLLALAAAPARADDADLWATVNVCDTTEHPDEIGIRASMPGGKTKKGRLRMRFRVQYRDPDDRWRLVRAGADSGWQRVPRGRRATNDYGWSFTFKPPSSGGAHVLRGLVTYEWRRGEEVLRRESAVTEGGHAGTAGADPAEFSSATCEIA